jgi:hypothetical protein
MLWRSELNQLCYHQYNQSIHVADGVTVTSLFASLQHKTQAATDHVGQMH